MKTHRFPLSDVRRHAKIRPAGYFDELVRMGRVDGDDLILTDTALRCLREKYQSHRLSLAGVIFHGIRSAARWVRAGLPLVDQETLDARIIKCSECPEWIGGAILTGRGRCRLCGCGEFKPWLATESCEKLPPEWRAVDGDES